VHCQGAKAGQGVFLIHSIRDYFFEMLISNIQ